MQLISQSFLFVVLSLMSTTVSATEEGSAAQPSFLRQLIPCDSSACPVEQPQVGDLCCYEGPSDCEYEFINFWNGDCTDVECTPLAFCSCVEIFTEEEPTRMTRKGKMKGNRKGNRKGRRKQRGFEGEWICAIARRHLAAEAPLLEADASNETIADERPDHIFLPPEERFNDFLPPVGAIIAPDFCDPEGTSELSPLVGTICTPP